MTVSSGPIARARHCRRLRNARAAHHHPANTTSIAVATDGTVSVTTAGNTTTTTEVGKITLATFTNPSGLSDLGRNLYVPTPAAGDPVVSQPGTQATGTISQGSLEMSNVSVVDEMVEPQ